MKVNPKMGRIIVPTKVAGNDLKSGEDKFARSLCASIPNHIPKGHPINEREIVLRGVLTSDIRLRAAKKLIGIAINVPKAVP